MDTVITMDMTIKKLILIFLLLLSSCGDSPFLKDKLSLDSVERVQGISEELFFKNTEVSIKTFWKQGPFVGDESRMLILFFDKNGLSTSTNLDFRVMLWMPTMGHGSFPITISKISDGIYEANEMFLTMPGYWEIHFQLFENTTLKDEIKWGLEL